MAKNGNARGRTPGNGDASGVGGGTASGGGGETTGRYVVLFREDAVDSAADALHQSAGLRVASTRDFESATADTEGGMLFHEIGAAVVSLDPDQVQSVGARATEASGDIIAVEPERVVHAIDDAEAPDTSVRGGELELSLSPISDASILDLERGAESVPSPVLPAGPELSMEYLEGYRDSIDALVQALGTRRQQAQAADAVAPALLTWSETLATWGLQATRATRSRFTGRGIRVAVLDTGFGPHGEFAGRAVRLASFVPGETPADGHGHGTHCIGTACGPRRPTATPAYGVAYQAEIFAGKVLSNGGSGTDGGILNGINWAVANGCRVVSMSLGAIVGPSQPFNAVFEGVARRALQRGTLIVAAAGNNGASGGAVNHPANCPSIMAVAALTDQLVRASFSCRGLNPNGGRVDIAAPGVNVYSSWPLAPFHRRLNGTSMATPHVAGVAAMYAQATGASGLALWNRLIATARVLGQPAVDVGRGLVQAPL